MRNLDAWYDAYKVHMSEYYAPKNFNLWYYFGSLALLALVIGCGSLFFSHVNDAGFWLIKAVHMEAAPADAGVDDQRDAGVYRGDKRIGRAEINTNGEAGAVFRQGLPPEGGPAPIPCGPGTQPSIGDRSSYASSKAQGCQVR